MRDPAIIIFKDAPALRSITVDRANGTVDFMFLTDKPEQLPHTDYDACHAQLDDIIDSYMRDLGCACRQKRATSHRQLTFPEKPLEDSTIYNLLETLEQNNVIGRVYHEKAVRILDLEAVEAVVVKKKPLQR